MMKQRFCLLLLVFSLSFQYAFPQSKYDYIQTDTTTSTGIKIKGGTPKDNREFIRVKFKDSISTYSPGDLIGYGLKDGRVYKSRKIPIDDIPQTVFVEELTKGKTSLYFYRRKGRKAYFIEKDSGILELLDEDLTVFKQMSEDCEYIGDAIKLATRSKKSLTKLVSRFNECEPRAFPYAKFGIVSGLSFARLQVPEQFGNISFRQIPVDPSASWFVGLFADLPVNMTDFSLNLGINYVKNGFSADALTGQTGTDIVVDISTLEVPLLVRYTFPRLTWRPFINLGANYAYLVDDASIIYRSVVNSNAIIIDEVNTIPFFSESRLGYSVGLGVLHNVDFRRTISTELRYSQLFGLDNTLGMQQINLLIGFSL